MASINKEKLVVGGGPAGLVAAINLNREGFNVTVLERQDRIGGDPGWHPSIHGTPLAIPGLWDYIGMDLSEAFAEIINNSKDFIETKEIESSLPFDKFYNTERGPRDSSLDSILFRIAEKEGVKFEFSKRFKEKDLEKSPKDTIIATGLSTGIYDWLGLDYNVVAGNWAYSEIERDYVSNAGYRGSFVSSLGYGYSGAMNGIWYVLLWDYQKVSNENLEKFKNILGETEGRTFDRWRPFKGHIPKVPKLFHRGFILTGTSAAFMEPALNFGITGALVSGKIAAIAAVDHEKGEAEFKRFTDGIIPYNERKTQPDYKPVVKMGDVWFEIE